jgi:hypothetical protein
MRRPVKRKVAPAQKVAVAAGGRWPAIVDKLIVASLAEDAAEREVVEVSVLAASCTLCHQTCTDAADMDFPATCR